MTGVFMNVQFNGILAQSNAAILKRFQPAGAEGKFGINVCQAEPAC
jgi:hypothetical protein